MSTTILKFTFLRRAKSTLCLVSVFQGNTTKTFMRLSSSKSELINSVIQELGLPKPKDSAMGYDAALPYYVLS